MSYHYEPSPFMLPTSHYDKVKADRAVTFINNLSHTKGKWAGKRFDLLPWQEQIVRDLFGIVKEDGNRQFLTAYIEIPKKNGKSELAAADQRVKKELAAASNETATRLADAERRAQAIIEEAKARATDEGNKIVAAARAEAEQQAIAAREALREQVAVLAVKGAEQILRKEINAGVHADLLNRLKTEL